MRRFLSVWLPHWPTDRWRQRNSRRNAPLVLIATEANRVRLTAIDASAKAEGLKLGMNLADARADAFGSIGLNRRQAHWAIKGLGDKPLPLFEFGDAAAIEGSNLPPVETGQEPDVTLPTQTAGEHVVQDYRETSLTLRQHPLALLRPQLRPLGIVQARDLATLPENRPIKLAGLVLVRQRPGTASGVIFATIEDETGVGNIIIWPKVFQQYRRAVLASRLICVTGKVQREALVIHLIADKLEDYTAMLSGLSDIAFEDSFDGNLARADEVRKPVREVQVIMPPSRDFR